MPGQPRKPQAAAHKGGRGSQAADGPALFGAEPADIAGLLAARVTDHHLHLAFQVLEAQLAVHAMQGMFGMCHGDKFHIAHFRAQVAGDAETANGQVGHAFYQQLLNTRQHLFTKAHAATAALRHEGGEGAHQAGIRISRVDHQAHFGFPALFHMVGEVFQLAGVFHQLARATQQHFTCVGEDRLAPVDAQQRYAKLVLHAGHGVAHRGLRTVQRFGRLGEAAMGDHGLQRAPLIEGNAGRFQDGFLLS